MPDQPRSFQLHRHTGTSGVSGTGHVADGVVFSDGHAAIHFLSRYRTTTPHPEGMESVTGIHCHDGNTRVVWVSDQHADRLARIAAAHHKDVDPNGGTTGDCVECGQPWPCPTNTWATTDRNPLATWDPDDDDPPPACSAGLLSIHPDIAVERCIVEGPHEQHVSALGNRWTNTDDGSDQ